MIRDELVATGLPHDAIIKHGNQRYVYGISLITNTLDYLIGLHQKPQYLLPQRNVKKTTRLIAEYWIRRWLRMRIKSPEVLERTRCHTVAYPITHGARVNLPAPEEDLFSGLS